MSQKFYTALLFLAFMATGAFAQNPVKTITDDDLQGGTSYTWSADTTYLLDGFVFLEDGGILTIEPGTVVRSTELPSMLGNALIILLMVRSRFTSLQIGSLSVSMRAIGKWSLVVLLATATIHLTNYYFLDTILSVVLAITLFIWAAFVVIDAYWRLGELA